jgi:hypothetical protein
VGTFVRILADGLRVGFKVGFLSVEDGLRVGFIVGFVLVVNGLRVDGLLVGL